MQRNWIGRSEGLHCAVRARSRDHPGREKTSSKSSPRATTRCSARNSWRSRPIIRSPSAAAAKNPALAEFIAECKRHGTAQQLIDTAEKKGFDTGMKAIHPFDPTWKLPVYVANFILMDYGTGAIFGCPAHDQRDLDFANKYKLGNTPVVCPPTQDPSSFVITDTSPMRARDGMINSRFLDGMTIEAAKEEVAHRLESQSRGNRPVADPPGQFPPARLGNFTPALLGLPDPDHSLRCLRHRAGAGARAARDAAGGRRIRSAGQSARPPSDLEARGLPAMRSAPRGAKRIPWTLSWIRPGISRGSPIPG